ncbi:MAG: MFS transporter [Ruminococcaceae bacterium]|nr:MFS transporter [Oscillospiraceae bacterium]
MPNQRYVNRMYCLMQMGYWGMLGSFTAFQSAILLDRGFSSGDVGVFLALGCLSGMVSMPLIGNWADKHPEVPVKWLFVGLLVPTLVINFAFFFTRPGWWGTAAVFLLLGVLETNSFPLIDSMAMQFINAGVDIQYSLGRGLGAFAYALICVIEGQQTARFGIQTAMLTHGVLIVAMMGIVSLFPQFPREALVPAEERKATHSALQVLRANPPFTLMLFGAFFGMIAIMPIPNFMVTMIGDLGGDSGHLGLAQFLMAASELPGAFLVQKFYRRYGSEKVVLVSLAFMIVRPALILASGSLAMLLLVQPIQMLGYGLFTPVSTYFTNENVAPEDRMQGQSLKMVITTGFGSMAGNLISGWALDIGGIPMMLTICIVSGCIGLCLGILAVQVRRRQAA